jgi:aminoglycoside phosphotransferase (APT) family kinase protein
VTDPAPEQRDFEVVGAYVSDVVGSSVEHITAVSRFPGGNRHAVYKVSYLEGCGARRDVVVRVSLDGAPTDRAQAQREATVLEHLAGVGAPRLHDFRSRSRWFATPAMCMEFLPGSQRELGSATHDELEQLGSVVGVLHSQPAGGLAEALGETGGIASYAEHRFGSILAELAWVRDPLPANVRDRLKRVAVWMETLWETWRDTECFRTDETLALLHGDIGPGNVLWGSEPALIDWEYTRLGDPADEIAYLFDQNGLTTPRRQAFWDGYQHHTSSQERFAQIARRVEWWERLTLFGSTLWWAERSVRRAEADADAKTDPAVARSQDYYSGHLASRLDRLGDRLT